MIPSVKQLGIAIATLAVALGFMGLTVIYAIGENRRDIDRIEATFQVEKVCSLSHQGQPCRDLFDRLARNLSKAQRFRLACDVLAALHIPEADKMRRAARCPPPIG
jgi:hypothetical protein